MTCAYEDIAGQTCQTAGREAGRASGALRYGEAMERCRLRAWSLAAQERGYHQTCVGRLQACSGGCLSVCIWRLILLAWRLGYGRRVFGQVKVVYIMTRLVWMGFV